MYQQDLDIDSQNFDCSKYVKCQLQKTSVQDLIKQHNTLQNEIKYYDQEIQTLVFENYSKFISSIDTVRKMKTDIQKVDSKMGRLTESMDRISQLSKKIDASLSIKRDEIIKLDTVNKDLSKLNNLCNFPHVIQKDLNSYYKSVQAKGSKKQQTNFDDHFNDTAQYYKQCFSMLENYKKEALIQPIYKETIQKLEQVRQILWASLMEFKQQNPLLQLYQNPDQIQISTQEARSAVKKLIYIMEDEEAIIKHYQKIIKERYLAITKELIEKATISKMVSGGFRIQNESVSGPELVSQIDSDLLKFLEDKHYECHIDELEDYKHQKEKEYVNNDSGVQGSLLWLINQLCQVIFRELRVEAKAVLRDKHHEQVAEQCIKEIIHGVFQGVTEKMSSKKINNFQVNEVFKKLQSELQSLFQRTEIRQSLKTEIIDKFSENVENICRGQVLTSFNQLRLQFLEILGQVKQDLAKFQLIFVTKVLNSENSYMELEQDVKREFMVQVTNCKQKLMAILLIRLLDLKAFVFQQQESYLREQQTYINLIYAALNEFCKFVTQVFNYRDITQESLTTLFLLDNQNKDKGYLVSLLSQEVCVIHYLFVNQFLQLYQKTLMSKIINQMIEVFPQCGIRPMNEQDQQRMQNLVSQSLKKNVIFFIQSCTEVWVENYFEQPHTNYKKEISKQAHNFANNMKQILIFISLLFPDQKRGLIKKQSILKQTQETGFNVQIERVMVRKCRSIDIVCYKGQEQTDRSHVLNSMTKYFLKISLDRIRRFNQLQPDEHRQYQIDFHFIIQLLFDLVSVDEEGQIVAFYLEVLDSLQVRCLQDSNIDPKVIESISNQARNQIKI